MNPKVSVIIPVYNTAAYLEKSLGSVFGQTYENIEIIAVNDGSPDHSSEILETLKQRESRLFVFNKKNEGAVAARIDGMKQASGEYIYYLDSDDYLAPDAIERLVRKAQETGADMVAGDFWLEFSPTDIREFTTPDFDSIDNMDFLKRLLEYRSFWFLPSRLHKRELLTTQNMSVPEDIVMAEDMIITLQITLQAKKVAKISGPIMYYVQRESSITHQKGNAAFRNQFMRVPVLIERILKETPYYTFLESSVEGLKIRVMSEIFKYHYFEGMHDRCKEAKKVMKRFPEIAPLLPRRARKLIRAFALSQTVGILVAKHYIRKKKL